MTLALHGKSKNRQWLLVAVALLAIFASIGAGLAVRSTANADEHLMEIEAKGGQSGSTGTEACEEGRSEATNEWHWVITDSAGIAPASIEVTFLYAGTITVPFSNQAGGVAHYYYYGFLGDTYLGATAIIDSSWSGQFNLSHYPCGQEPPQTELSVLKTATATYDRTCEWTIEKTGDQTALTLSPGQTFTVNYEVVVDADCTDDNFQVSGTITVFNSGDYPATVNSVTDEVDGVAADVDCDPVEFPYVLAAGANFTCTYSLELNSKTDGNNIATANADDLAPAGQEATTDTDYDSEPVGYTFGAPATTIDGCIDVTDDKYGVLGTVCYGVDTLPKTFTYSLQVGPYEGECVEFRYVNVATFVTDDTGDTGSDSWTVVVTLPCGQCTLTPGYWKTHSSHGPARYDDAWANIGEDSPFFSSGQTYYQVLWTAPGGNVYYILAHAYIAAKLNILDGAASTPAVDAAITAAETFFNSYSPNSALGLSKPARAALINFAKTLDDYNNGLTGPGHCSE